MLVGEVGIDRNTFLYEIEFWEIRLMVDGYRRRERTFCLMTRWATFMNMCTGMADISKSGIHSPEDLIRFSWEKEADEAPPISEDEQEEIRAELRRLNSQQ